MYFKTENIFNESAKFTLKNFTDFFRDGSNENLKKYEEKMRKIDREFYSMYNLTNKGRREILKAILDYNAKSKLYEIIDFDKCDSFHHLHLFMKLNDPEFSRMDLVRMYSVFHKMMGGAFLNGYYSKYILTVPIFNKYIVFIAFDEKGVDSVEALASENMFDITANMNVVKLNVNKKMFEKGNKDYL